MSKNAEWLAEQIAKYQDDPEFITYGILDDVTDVLCGAMEAQGMSRADLARKMGVSRAYVTQFLNTPLNTRVETVVRFASAVGLDVKVSLERRASVGGTYWTDRSGAASWGTAGPRHPLRLLPDVEPDLSMRVEPAA